MQIYFYLMISFSVFNIQFTLTYDTIIVHHLIGHINQIVCFLSWDFWKTKREGGKNTQRKKPITKTYFSSESIIVLLKCPQWHYLFVVITQMTIKLLISQNQKCSHDINICYNSATKNWFFYLIFWKKFKKSVYFLFLEGKGKGCGQETHTLIDMAFPFLF